MRDAKFPLCERAGLKVWGSAKAFGAQLIEAEKVEALLANAPVVYGAVYPKNTGDGVDLGSIWNQTKLNDHTYTARLLMIEEIVRESEERQLLRELFDKANSSGKGE